ncbi:MAG: NADH-quinone oxidoreductase subunit M [Thermaerobacter sp.]|nr:NADH-quinone oxidoreductase subunit M [Thermaerobacter sp.]
MLELLFFLPIIGALLLLLLPERAARGGAFIAALLTLAVSLVLIPSAFGHSGAYGMLSSVTWVEAWGVHWALGLDGLSLVLTILTALVTAVAIAWTPARPRTYYVLFLLLEAFSLGTFLAADLFVFYVFWEAMIIPAYLLIAGFGGPRRAKAAIKFLIYSLAPSLLMLVAIVTLGYEAFLQFGSWSFSLPVLQHLVLPTSVQMWVFAGFAIAFLVKIPAFPFHSWMPEAYAESPAPVTAMLSAVLSKTALYGFLRIALPLMPVAAHRFAPALGVIALASILYGALVALTQRDGKLVIGYSSLSHLGLVLLGIAALSYTGLEGAVLQMVNHGIYATALFLLFGVVEERMGTRDLQAMGGLEARGPILAGLFLITVLTALGLPGLQGFAGEITILTGVYLVQPVWAWIAVISVILAAAYFIRLFQKVAHGTAPSTDQPGGRPEIGGMQIALVAPLIVLMFVLGLYPNPVPRAVSRPLKSVTQSVGVAATTRATATSEVAGK